VPSEDGAAINFCAWVWVQAELREERAADTAASVALRHERLVEEGGTSLRRFHRQLAEMHRRVERDHRAVARVHAAHAAWLLGSPVGAYVVRPVGPELLITVAAALGARAAGLTLLGSARHEESAVSSEPMAAAAQELEFTLGEGPAHDAASGRRSVVADERALPVRWARYSPAVVELGVHSVAAAPLCLHSICLGVLTAFDPHGDTIGATVHGIAAVLLTAVLGTASAGTEWLLAELDDRLVVHQATGMVAERLGCSTTDALGMLRARAFAENEAIGALARRVVDRQVVFE
jgi:ANTAR domain